MTARHENDAEDDASRSYCVFERDRALPRPTPWRPLMTDTPVRKKTSVKTWWSGCVATIAGLVQSRRRPKL
ncbi:MAG: hypothetical protein J0I08_14070 [Rhizobiales bacterium]|jgi:hypothetical protein|nr:hypothetical protein [Hyphomicrobiales bacterium]